MTNEERRLIWNKLKYDAKKSDSPKDYKSDLSMTGIGDEMKHRLENDRRLRRMFYIIKQKFLTFSKR